MNVLRLGTLLLLAVLFVSGCAKKSMPAIPTTADVDIPADAGIFPAPADRPKGPPQTDVYGDELPPGVIARLGTVRMRHAFGRVYMVKFSADGKTLMSHGEDGTIRLWNSLTGREMAKIPGVVPPANRPLPSSRLSPDGKILLTWDKGFHAWDTDTSKELPWSLNRESVPNSQACSDLVFSDDGKSFATVLFEASEGRIQVRDIMTGEVLHEQIQQLDYNRCPLRILSPNGAITAIGETDASALTLFDTSTGKVLQRWEATEFAGFSPDSKRVLCSNTDFDFRRRIAVRDVASGQEYCRFVVFEGEWVVFSPDGKKLAVTNLRLQHRDQSSFVKVLDAATGKTLQKWPGCPQGSAHLCFTPDGNRVVSADRDNAIRVWDTESGKIAYRLEFECPGVDYACLDVSPDGKLLAASGSVGPIIHLWSIDSGKPLNQQDAPLLQADFLAFSPNGKSLALIDGEENTWVWDTSAVHKAARLPRFPADDKYLPLVGTVLIWRGNNNVQAIGVAKKHTMGMGPDGSVNDSQNMVHQLDLNAGKPIRQFGTHAAPIRFSTVSPDGKALAGWVDNQVHVWDTATGEEMKSFPLTAEETDSALDRYSFHRGTSFLVVGPHGKVAVRGIRHISDTKYIGWLTVWGAGDSKDRNHFEWEARINGWKPWRNEHGAGSTPLFDDQNGSMCFSADGKMLALCFKTGIALWDLTKGKEVRRIEAKNVVGESIAFSSDAKLIAARTASGGIRFWNTATGALVGQVSNAPRWITQFCFSPDGRTLATACSDSTVLLWDIQPILTATSK